jgi:hypothetical protein
LSSKPSEVRTAIAACLRGGLRICAIRHSCAPTRLLRTPPDAGEARDFANADLTRARRAGTRSTPLPTILLHRSN